MSTNDFWSLVDKEKKKKAGYNSGLSIGTTPTGAFGDLVKQNAPSQYSIFGNDVTPFGDPVSGTILGDIAIKKYQVETGWGTSEQRNYERALDAVRGTKFDEDEDELLPGMTPSQRAYHNKSGGFVDTSVSWADKTSAVIRLIQTGGDTNYELTDKLLKQLEAQKERIEQSAGWDNAGYRSDLAEIQGYYNELIITKNASILAKTKMEGKNHSVLEEIQQIANLDGAEKKKRKEAVLNKMEELGIPKEDYAAFTDDSNFSWGEFSKWAWAGVGAGINSFNVGLAATGDAIFGNILKGVGWENNPFSVANEYYKGEYEASKFDLNLHAERLGGGKGWGFASDALEGTVGALPNALLAFATRGQSLASTSSLSTTAAYQASNWLGRAGITVETMAKNPQFWTSFVSTYGRDYEEAKELGANDTVAGLGAMFTSLVNAGIEIGVDGGSGFQGLPDDLLDGNKKKVWSWVESSLEEGGEEGLQKFISEMVTKVAYDPDAEILDPKEYAREMSLGVVSGATLGGGQIALDSGINSYNQYQANKLTDDEQAVVDKVVEEYIAEQEKEGKKITARERANYRKNVEERLRRGYVTAEKIEEILGGEDYSNYKAEKDKLFASEDFLAYNNAVKEKKNLAELEKQLEELKNAPNTVGNIKAYDALQSKIEDIKTGKTESELFSKLQPGALRVAGLENTVRAKVRDRVNGTRLAESYRELERRNEKPNLDPSKYTNEAARATVQNIKDSGIGNGTNEFADTVEFLAGLSTKTGRVYKLMTEEQLREAGYWEEGSETHGLVDDDGNILLNYNSSRNLYWTIGHETGHAVEKAGRSEALRKALFNYAIAKEGQEKVNARLEEKRAIYKNKKNTTPEIELAWDLLGEYGFTDYEFIRTLAKTERNVFQKIFDEIKSLYKIAVAGSKQQRELEKAKRLFQKALDEVGNEVEKSADGSKFSLENGKKRKYNKSKKSWYSQAETEFLSWQSGAAKVGTVKRFVRNGKVHYYEKTETGCVELSRSQFNERNGANVEDFDRRAERRFGATVNYDESTQRGTVGYTDGHRDTGRSTAVFGQALEEEFSNDTTGSVPSTFGYNSRADINQTEYDEEASGDPGASFVTFSNDYQYFRNRLKEGDTGESDAQYSITKDSDGKELTKAQQEFFKDTKAVDNDGNLKTLYHGSRSEAFSTFDLWEGVWLTTDPRYAEIYAGQWHSWRDDFAPVGERRTDLNGLEPEVYSDPDYRVYKMYANITNPADIGELDIPLSDAKVRQLAKTLGIRYTELKPLADEFVEEETYMLTRSREFIELAKEKGFDGFKATEKGKETWCAFVSEDQVKLTSNTKPTVDHDVRYSMTKDSEGNQLDKAQQEFFKDSKIVDEDGNLKVMYHGSPEAFTVFDRKKAKSSGYYGKGFYFTDSESHAGQYGNKYEVYLNITNPLQDGTNDITKKQLRNFVEAIADNEDYGIDNYGYGATVDSVTDAVYGKSDFAMLMDINASCVGNMVEAIELFNEVNGTDYNGIIAPTETVAFYPNQIKSVANSSPTADPDIRFSLSKAVEETKDLMALHNLTADELPKALALGGMPMPSIAVLKAEQSHEAYGDVSLIFPKDAIDPKKNKYNKVYGGDAWTPVYPSVEYKVNEKAQKAIESKIDSLVPYDVQRGLGHLSLDYDNMSSDINRHSGELYRAYQYNYAMQYAFLVDNGFTEQLPMTEKDLDGSGRFKNDLIIDVAEKLGAAEVERLTNASISGDDALIAYLMDMANENAKKKYAGDSKLLEVLRNRPLYTEKNFGFAQADSIIRAAHRYVQNGLEQTVDYKAAKDVIEKAVDKDAYKAWLDNLFADIVEKEGIRNNADYYTPSGNRRSWEALHWENTLENVLKVMRAQNQTGEGFFGGASIFGVATKDYGSIEEAKADSDRLRTIPEEEYDAMKSDFSQRLADIADSIKDPNEHNRFIALDNAVEEIVDAVRTSKNKSSILRNMQKWNKRVTPEIVDDIVSLVNDVSNMPTGYFEAKPQRAVGFDEVAVFVIPRNADTKLKQELLSRGYNIAEYDPDVEGDRQKVVNQFEEYKFSLTPNTEQNASNETRAFNDRWSDFGKRDPLAEFIPIREDVAPAPDVAPETVSKAETVEDMFPDNLPSVDEELNNLLQQKEALENRMQEALNDEDYDAFAIVNDEYNSLMARLEELEQEAADMDADRLSSLNDADVPPVRENEWLDRADVVPLTKKAAQEIARDVRQRLALSNKQMYDVHELIEEYSQSEFPDRQQLFEDIKRKFGTYSETITDDFVKEAKHYLRTVGVSVSDSIKGEIADYANLMRRNRGRILFKKDGLPVDVMYQELHSYYPGLFPDSIYSPTDQFVQMVEVANMDAEQKYEQEMPDDAIWDVADAVADGVTRYQQTQKEKTANKSNRESFTSLMRDADQYVPTAEDIVPDVVAEPTVAEIAPTMENDIPTKNIAPSKADEPTTANERLAKKLENYQNELAKNQQLRAQSAIDYDNEIARLQAEYDAKQNKRSISANDLLRRIEKIKRMKNNVDADYAKRIGDIEKRIEKLNTKEAKTAAQRQTKMEQHTEKWKNLIGDTSTWKDMALGLSYKTKTLRRILRKVVRGADGKADIALADQIYDELETKYDHNEALLKRESRKVKAVFEKLNLNHAEDTYAHLLGEFRHNPETTLTKDVVDEYYNKHKRKIDTKKVNRAIAEARKTFDDLLTRVNKALKEQGFKEIPYRKGYFPHFTNPKQGLIAKLFNWKTIDTEVPTSIAGLTETFTPQRSWQSFNKERKGDTTDYSLYQGLDTYIHGALDWIYHIDDLQSRRALENHIRYVHSEEGVKARIDEIKANEEYDADEAQMLIDGVLKEAENPLSGLVRELMRRTNTLANKKASGDRKWEDDTNRKFYSTMTNLNNRINANMVVGSFSSALTNFIPLVQSWHQVSPYFTVRGLGDYVRSVVRDDGMIEKSDFLTNRLIEEEKLYQTGWDKVTDKAAFMMNVIDGITSQTVWRSKYLQNLKEGMSESRAIKDADQFAKNLMAGRSRGNAPTIFDEKNPITKIFTAFQLEVANQYGYMFEDVPQDTKNKARLVKGYATAFMGAYLYNALYSSLVGRDAAFDPISILEDLFRDLSDDDDDDDDEDDVKDALLGLGENVLQEIPYVGGLFGGGRVPMSSAFPYSSDSTPVTSFLGDVETIEEDGNWKPLAKELLKPLYYLALPVGGGQLKKTIEGLSMFDDDLPVSGSYTDSGALRFPVEDTPWNRIQAGMFGQYASKNASEYFDNGYAPLNEKQIQEYIDVDIPISDYWEYREGLSGLDSVEEKVSYINDLDLPISKKNILVNNQLNRKEKVDLTNYDDYGSWAEFNFANENPDKYNFFKSIGVTYQDYANADEKGKDAYNWAFENPGKYTVSKVVTGDLFEYRKYTNDLYNIRADKDSNGKTINGSAKAKKVDYINSLNIEYGAKLILYKVTYPADDTYNAAIVSYINAREDLTYEDRVTILKELGFTVNNGTVYWN